MIHTETFQNGAHVENGRILAYYLALDCKTETTTKKLNNLKHNEALSIAALAQIQQGGKVRG